ncbi:MAG: TonB-dependent receptor [Flavobacteriia bacterium]|nr:TonB-dependent receptor [Flavobacteriia bacterium]
MRKVLFFLSILASVLVFGQDEIGIGWRLEISDEANLNIPAARVFINDSLAGLTDEGGAINFIFEKQQSIRVRIEAEGYTTAEAFFESIPFGLATGIKLERSGVLGDVVVIGTRARQSPDLAPISIDVVKPYLITERVQSDIEQTVQQASGVHVSDGSVNIRSGSGWSYGAGSRVLVLLDEMPIISPDAGQAQWSLLPTEAVQSMEVLKGAASSLYGTSAMNGIINVSTLDPTSEPHTDIRMYQGFYDSPKRPELKWWEGIRGWTGTQFNHTMRTGNDKEYGWVIAGQAEHNGGYQYDVPDHRGRLLGKFQYFNPESPEWSYSLTSMGLWSSTGDALLWNGYDQAYIPLDSQSTKTTGFDFIVDPEIRYANANESHTLRGRFMLINNNAESETTSYYNASRMGFLEYLYQFSFDALSISAGANGQYGRSNSEVFEGLHTLNGQAAFLQADYDFKWVTLTGGIRYEALQLDNTRWSRPVVRLGANGGTRSTRFRASYGEGFRFPTMAEVYTRTNVGALQVFPNRGLNPESGWSAEAGVRQLFAIGLVKGYVDLAAFWMHYDNMMEFSFGKWGEGSANPIQDFGFRSINVGSTEVPGIELSSALEVSIGENGKLTAVGGLTWMEPRPLDPDFVYATHPGFLPTSPDQELSYTSTSSNPESGILKYRYQWLGKFDAQYEQSWWMVGFSVRYNDFMQNVDGIFLDPLFSQLIPGVEEARQNNVRGDWILDMRVRANVSQSTSISFVVSNLTNLEYYPRPALVGPMRSFALQLRYRI